MNRGIFRDTSLSEVHPFVNGDSDDAEREWMDPTRVFLGNLVSRVDYTPSPNSVDITSFITMEGELTYLERVWFWAQEFNMIRHILTKEEEEVLKSESYFELLNSKEDLP